MAELLSEPRQLKNIAFSFPSEQDDWSPEYFNRVYETIKNAGELDLDSPEGLEAYVELVPSAAGWDIDTIRKNHSKLVRLARQGFNANTLANLNPVIGVLGDDGARAYALNVPAFQKEGNVVYNAAAKAVNDFHYIKADIKKNPDAYLEEAMRGLNNDSKRFFLADKENVLMGELLAAQKQGELGLALYSDYKGFVEINLKRAKQLSDESETRLRQRAEKLNQLKTEKMRESGRVLSAAEELRLERDFEESEEGREYKDYVKAKVMLPEMVQILQDIAYETRQADSGQSAGNE
jgi:hypothetical protein